MPQSHRAPTLERLDPDACNWRDMDALPDRVLFQTREWLDFLARTQQAEPVVAAVMRNGEHVGYFTGAIVKRYGLRILGSPLPGWTTPSMGFNLFGDVTPGAAVEAVTRFAFGPMRCSHLELTDRRLTPADVAGLDFEATPTLTYEIDLAGSEDHVLGRMSSACRRAIRRGEKVGTTVERVRGPAFAQEYYAQLEEVFARQALVPTYPVERVRELIHCLEPTDRLLLLRACSPDGRPIATGIFVAFNGTAYFWGGASWRRDQHHRPNEAIFWHAMRHWRGAGMTTLDMGGGGDYKLRYGPREVWLPALRRSRFRGLRHMRELVRVKSEFAQRRRGRNRARDAVAS